MQFTTQQLAGGARYNSKVKVGNWNEDRRRIELEAKDYENRRAGGKLLINEKARQRLRATQSVRVVGC